MVLNPVVINRDRALILSLAGFAALVAIFAVVRPADVFQGSVMINGYFVSQPPDVRAREATSIALVTVQHVAPARWDSHDGKAPASVQREVQAGNTPLIFRPVTLRVERYLKNPQPQPVLNIRLLGGTADGTTMSGLNGLELEEGMRAVVFLTHEVPPGTWKYSTIYTITGDMAYSAWDEKTLQTNELLSVVTSNVK